MQSKKTGDWETLDGNAATTYVAYAMSDVACIYPITPSSPMGELADEYCAAKVKNVHGHVCEVRELQSEGGAAGSVHGALSAGALATTFTASQGLLLMVPNIYKLVGELLPGVIHVAARSIAGEALSIFGDFQDIMAVRQTGICLLGSSSVQECMDLALVAHLCAVESSMPFIHFFDGFRLSHAVEKIQVIGYDDMRRIFPYKKAEAFRKGKQLSPVVPIQRGTSQGPEMYFQSVERANTYFVNIIDVVQEKMEQVGHITGRKYKILDYFGDPEAETVLICMGSGGTVALETVEWVNEHNDLKVGLIKVRLFRPFPKKQLVTAIPSTCKVVSVLDRTKEPGANGEPLYVDTCSALFEAGRMMKVVGGRYGLGSKDFTPAQVKAVIENSMSAEPVNGFTVGIVDDVSHLSLPVSKEIETVAPGTVQVQLWGLGQDGTVSSAKAAIKIIGSSTDNYAQGYFAYDAKKAGGLTVNHLRFGPQPIHSQYLVHHADFVSCNNETYVFKFNVLRAAKEGAVFVLNSSWPNDELDRHLPERMRREIARKKLKFYNIDAAKVAADVGMAGRINMVMLTAFFKLSKVLDIDESIKLLKGYIKKQFQRKGMDIVEKNWTMVDRALENLHEVHYPSEWADAQFTPLHKEFPGASNFVNSVISKCSVFEGDDLPVSAFKPGGVMEMGTSKYEKRGIALEVPRWLENHCIQCNICAFVCPHAVIRPFLMNAEEKKGIEGKMGEPCITLPAQGKGLQDLEYRIQISQLDCTGCSVCVDACPGDAEGKALVMVPFHEEEKNAEYWDDFVNLPLRSDLFDRETVKGSQMFQPLMEFSGACAGCGETPYIKLVTQLFGERMIIANATGCTSIYGGSAPFCPYSTNTEGEGPTWANSLFEDAAEYGYGMVLAKEKRRAMLAHDVQQLIERPGISERFRDCLTTWLQVREDVDQCEKYYKMIAGKLSMMVKKEPEDLLLEKIYNSRHFFKNVSQWIIGGDGWAYDIGYGGLDHVLASGVDVNILVVDTEVYSNTGGQTSKATPLTAVHKFAALGKRSQKKDLGLMALTYGNVFVAQCSMGYNNNQTINAIKEAESFKGPSLVICYAPCIEHGIKHNSPSGMGIMLHQEKLVVEAGMWPLYTYDPRREQKGLNPLVLQSKAPKMEAFEALIASERRFQGVWQVAKQDAAFLTQMWKDFVIRKRETYERLALDMKALKAGALKQREGGMLILFGTETGNSGQVANSLADMCDDREIACRVVDMADFDSEKLSEEKVITLIVSTYGDGEMPASGQSMWEWISNTDHPTDLLAGVQFTVFALGDSSYEKFCWAGKEFQQRFKELGAKFFYKIGLGDDQDPAKYDTALEAWLEGLWDPLREVGGDVLKAQAGAGGGPKAKLDVKEHDPLVSKAIKLESMPAPADHEWVSMVKARLLSGTGGPVGEHPTHEYTFDISGNASLQNYSCGDALSVWPCNPKEETLSFLNEIGLDPDLAVTVTSLTGKALPWPNQPLPLSEVFVRYLDLFGRTSKAFFSQLLKHATDKGDQERLKQLLSKEGAAAFDKDYVSECVTVVDLLREFKSVRPDLATLLSIIPLQKPRLYSIGSSPNYHRGKVILAVVYNQWETPRKRILHGLNTRYLRELAEGSRVAVGIHAGTMAMPADVRTPIVMSALGTGLAPFMSFIYERIYMRDTLKQDVGEMTLYFGCRYKKVDYIYGEELEGLVEDKILRMKVAFSRDQAHKIYVQNKIEEDEEAVYDLIVKKKGHFYYCGRSGRAPSDVKKALIGAIQHKGEMGQAEATEEVEKLVKVGRYAIEAW